MIFFPAIDLKDGKCVRLLQGEMQKATIFNTDPANQARSFFKDGAEWIHVVDLNGAFSGKPINESAINDILTVAKVNKAHIQLGGGIRNLSIIENWLLSGVNRVVLGTAAVKNPELVKNACRHFPGHIAVGIDARNGKVAVEGWTEEAEMNASELGLRFENEGVEAIIFTDIERDGALGGVNVSSTVELAKTLTTPIIASGGISSLSDLQKLLPYESEGIAGVISGMAIYDGRLELKEALDLLKDNVNA